VLRFVFDAPTEWVNETSVYLVMVSAFLGFAPALASGKHISVDLLITKFPPKTNKLLGAIVSLLGLIFSLVFLVTSTEMALNSYRLNMLSVSTLRIPLYLPQLALPVGFALLSLQFIANLLSPTTATAEKEGHQ
jgi:C4-dicarboxylate transporter, DctQ subunit